MAGLDAISDIGVSQDTSASPRGALPSDFVSVAGPKGSKSVLDSRDSADILAKMQKFVDDRTQQSTSGNIGRAFSDAALFSSHPEAFIQRQQNDQANSKDAFEMQMQLAQYKAALAQQEAFRKMQAQLYGGQAPTQATSSAPTQATGSAPKMVQGTGFGGTPTMMPEGAMSLSGDQSNAPRPNAPTPKIVTTTSGQSFNFNDIPPEIRASALAQRDYDSFQKVVDTWAEKHSEKAQDLSNNLAVESQKNEYARGMEPLKFANNPEANTQKVYFINGSEVMMTPLEYSHKAQVPLQSAIDAGKSTTPEAAPTTTFDTKKSYGTPAKILDNLSAAESSHNPYAINKDSKALGRYQFSPETAAQLNKQGIKFNPLDGDESRAAADWYIQKLVKENGGDYAKALAQYGGFKTKDPSQYVAKVMDGVQAPTVANQAPTEKPQGYAEYKQNQEAQKAMNVAEQGKSGQDWAAKHSAAIQAADNAPEDLANAKYIRNLVDKNPTAFGVLQHPTVLSAIGTALSEGINAPQVGYTHISSIDDAVRKAMPGSTEQDITAVQKAGQKFAELQLNKAKVVLKGQGSVSDNERRLVANMTGNINNSPSALRDMLTWGEMRSKYDDSVGSALKRWERTNPNASYRQFELTPEYENLKNQYAGQIRAFADKAGNYSTPKPGAKISLPPHVSQDRYNAWKKAQTNG